MKLKRQGQKENSHAAVMERGGLPKDVEWLMFSFEGPPREITFRVLRPSLNQQGKSVTVSVHAQTIASSASDEFVSSFAKQQIEQFLQIERNCALARNVGLANVTPSTSSPKLFAIHVRDVQQDVSCPPVILPGLASDTVETFRSKLIKYFKDVCNRNITSFYVAMIAEVERRGWRFSDLRRSEKAKERWRELCAVVHPLWMTDDMTEKERGGFARRSHDTIFKNLKTGRFKSKNYDQKRTQGLTSHKGPDESTRVRKSAKKPTRPH